MITVPCDAEYGRLRDVGGRFEDQEGNQDLRGQVGRLRFVRGGLRGTLRVLVGVAFVVL